MRKGDVCGPARGFGDRASPSVKRDAPTAPRRDQLLDRRADWKDLESTMWNLTDDRQ